MIIKIYGAPGTGKTTKMLDLLQDEVKRTPLERIAFVTHTVAARMEAKERINRVMSIVDEKKQLRYFRTIHGICYMENALSRDNVMQSEDYLEFGNSMGIPFSANFTNDRDMDGLPMGFSVSGGNAILAARQYADAQCKMVSQCPEAWPEWASPKLMRQVIIGYRDWKEKHAKFDFVDMLSLYDTHGQPLDIDVMFIDESQDLSKRQWMVVAKMMASAKIVYIAGDDDQTIYAFIGADRYGFLDHSSDDTIVLPTTWRLLDNIWAMASKIISGVSKRQHKEIATRGAGGEIDFYNSNLLYMPLDPSHSTMIIGRHHSQLQELALSLEARGIPYKGKGREIHGTEQATTAHAYFRARNGEKITLRDAALVMKYVGNKEAVKQLRFQARDNIGEIATKELLEKEYHVNFEAPWVKYLARFPAETAKNEIIQAILNNMGWKGVLEEPKVALMTYHGSKGREADHVILLTDCFKKAHDYARNNPDDEKRLAYVGVTRARERLTIVTPKSDMWMRPLL